MQIVKSICPNCGDDADLGECVSCGYENGQPGAHMFFSIEQEVPIPSRQSGSNNGRKYPFHIMNMGDSFFVPCSKGKTQARLQSNITTSANKLYKDRKFVTRQRVEKGVKGVRCWRVPNV